MEETILELTEAELEEIHGGQAAGPAICMTSMDGQCVCDK